MFLCFNSFLSFLSFLPSFLPSFLFFSFLACLPDARLHRTLHSRQQQPRLLGSSSRHPRSETLLTKLLPLWQRTGGRLPTEFARKRRARSSSTFSAQTTLTMPTLCTWWTRSRREELQVIQPAQLPPFFFFFLSLLCVFWLFRWWTLACRLAHFEHPSVCLIRTSPLHTHTHPHPHTPTPTHTHTLTHTLSLSLLAALCKRNARKPQH